MKQKLTQLFFIISLAVILLSPGFVFASETNGTIDSTYKYAWSENIGWINFACDNCNVQITDSAMTGYAWSANYGWKNLNPSTSGVSNNSEGTLSGSAWGENTGWIDFSGVTIDSSGYFSGYASGTVTGQISFNCANTSSCGSSDFKVRTDWRPVSTRDSGSGAGGGGGAGRGDETPPTVFVPGPETVFLEPERIDEDVIPEQLFDINFELDGNIITRAKDLVVRVTFTSFGTEPTPVEMTFMIRDQSGQEFHQSIDSLVVETEAVFTKKFEDAVLAFGDYTLVLTTLYNVDVEDEFYADFKIIEPSSVCSFLSIRCWIWYIIAAVIIALIVFIIFQKNYK